MFLQALYFFLFLVGWIPLTRAWWANRRATLIQAIHWAAAAWMVWGLRLAGGQQPAADGFDWGKYLALSMTGCAGVAVLGARRPHVGAWNFVVLGLLAVMLLPMAEHQLLGTQSLDWVRGVFLASTLAVGFLNYLPTRAALAALLLIVATSGQSLLLFGLPPNFFPPEAFFSIGILGVPWLAWWCYRRGSPVLSAFDAVWLNFRDRFGLVWGQRVREQFNHAARHAGWPVTLFWQGLLVHQAATFPSPEMQGEMVQTLRALLKRFEGEA